MDFGFFIANLKRNSNQSHKFEIEQNFENCLNQDLQDLRMNRI
jgi:hypothetical protein